MGYRLNWQGRGVIKHFFGRLTPADIVGSVVECEGDIRFDELRWAINDFTETTDVAVGLPEVDEVAIMDFGAAKTNPHIRIAIVSATPEIVALSQLYQSSPLNVYPLRIFDTLESALQWVEEALP